MNSFSNGVKLSLDPLQSQAKQLKTDMELVNVELRDLKVRMAALGFPFDDQEYSKLDTLPAEVTEALADFDRSVDNTLRANNHRRFPALTQLDFFACVLAGAIAVIVDVVFVGTPEVVKIYHGPEKFDGSIFTSILRQSGNKDSVVQPLFQWLSDHCKVPYDKSTASGIVTPNNHRLRNPAHDPVFGLLFAVVDIIMGTTTAIDNNGVIRIIKTKDTSMTQKWMAVILYMGHIISDVATARGIPIPGSFVTQFFTKGGETSIARIAEDMYNDGYDLRHLASMSTPVIIKKMLLTVYWKSTQDANPVVSPLYDKEKRDLDKTLKLTKMLFVSDCIATAGNAVKYFAPPSCGNPCSLNLPEWLSLANNGIVAARASFRDFSVEEAIGNRADIDAAFERLLN